MAMGRRNVKQPLEYIGANDLIRGVHGTYSGKLCKLRKIGQFEKFLNFKKWQEKLAVISKGWLYIFEDQNSPKPTESYNMSTFDRVEMDIDDEECYRFYIEFIPNVKPQEHLIFACATKEERQEWISMLKRDSGISVGDSGISVTSPDYDYVQTVGIANTESLYTVDYDDCGYIEARLPPTIPQYGNQATGLPKADPPLYSNNQGDFKRETYFYRNRKYSDNLAKLLERKKEGTFLVCDGLGSVTYEIFVQHSVGVMCWRIHEAYEMLYVEANPCHLFPTLDLLLHFHRDTVLPTKSMRHRVTLNKGYRDRDN